MYHSCKPTIISAINLLKTDPSFGGHIHNNNHHKRSLLPFLDNAIRWLTGTAPTKDVNSIKEHVNQLIELNQHSKKPWYTLYLFLTSQDTQHK